MLLPMNRAILALALFAAALVPVSCGFGRRAPQRPYVPVQLPVSSTRQEVLDFARHIADAINSGDPSALDDAIDYDALGRRATDGLINGDRVRRNLFANGAGVIRFGRAMVEQTAKGAQLNFIGLYWNGARPRLFYRFDLPSGINYFEFYVGQNETGRPCIVDIQNHMDGELISTRIRRVVGDPRALVAFLPGAGPTLGLALDTLNKLQVEGLNQSVLDYCATLPEDLRNDKAVMVRRVISAKMIDSGQYHQALRSMHEVFAGDHSCDLLFVDLFTIEHQWDSVLAAIDGIDSSVGRDPHLDLLRVNLLVAQKEYDEASKCVFRYMAHDSTSSKPWLALVDIYVGEKRYAAAAAALDTLSRRFDITFDTGQLEGLEGFGGFIASPEYRAWKKRRQPAG
jgi:hypothetical protein